MTHLSLQEPLLAALLLATTTIPLDNSLIRGTVLFPPIQPGKPAMLFLLWRCRQRFRRCGTIHIHRRRLRRRRNTQRRYRRSTLRTDHRLPLLHPFHEGQFVLRRHR